MKNKVYGLTCCDLFEPAAIDSNPRFSWKYSLKEGTGIQTAYRIKVESLESVSKSKALIWDTGIVDSSYSTHLEYKGEALVPRTQYKWNVSVYDDAGNEFLAVSNFTTGSLGERWTGRWISAGFHIIDWPAPFL